MNITSVAGGEEIRGGIGLLFLGKMVRGVGASARGLGEPAEGGGESA